MEDSPGPMSQRQLKSLRAQVARAPGAPWFSHRFYEGDYELALVLKSAGELAEADLALAKCARRLQAEISRSRTGAPSLPYACDLLARVLLAGGDLDAALRLAQRAAELDPHESLFQLTLSTVHEDLGDKRKAIDAVRRAVTLRPYHEGYRARLEKLQR